MGKPDLQQIFSYLIGATRFAYILAQMRISGTTADFMTPPGKYFSTFPKALMTHGLRVNWLSMPDALS